MFDITTLDGVEGPVSTVPKSKYDDEWNDLCRLSESGLPLIQRYAIDGGLQGSTFRSIIWQLLLHSLPTKPPVWIPVLRQRRHNYQLIRQRFSLNPHDVSDDNPLSQSSESKWNQYFCDKELRALIRQDVIRTFPGIDFFRSESIQCTMVNVLFCYARDHTETCYRQGMHEVLAPIIYVMHCDQQSLLHAQETASVCAQAVEVLDPTCLEEDAYCLFSKLMSHVGKSYQVKDVTPLVTGHFPVASGFCFKGQMPEAVETEVASHLKWIRDKLLSHFDPELYQHVSNLDIPFQIFGIRWLRVLFGQEFPLVDLLLLWDTIFAADEDFALVNYIIVSMLIAVRDELLSGDDNDCLMLLMRYPADVSIKLIIELALHMCRPEEYPLPASHHGFRQTSCSLASKTPSPGKFSGRLKQITQWSKRKMVPATSKSQAAMGNAPITSANTHTSKPKYVDGRQGIVEGFVVNDPNVMRAELHHMRAVLSLVYNHLERHRATLENTLPSNTPSKARAALAGIKELCIQLRPLLPAVPRALEVEAASEAQPAALSSANGRLRDPQGPKMPLPSPGTPLKEFTYDGGAKPKSCLPQDDPLRALPCVQFERDLADHIAFCKVLGARFE